mgnify:CR=1 FL=1
MLLGAMNNPMQDTVEQIVAFREAGFDFLDLTLEPERARSADLDVYRIRQALAESELGIVGHTAWYLPLASPFDELRAAAIREVERCLEVFAALGATLANVHPDARVPLYDDSWIVARNVDALQHLAERAGHLGLMLMLENLPGLFGRVEVLRPVFEAVPALAFHLDVGHANLLTPTNNSEQLLESFGSRLAHVHLSDNKGGDRDLHLPLGAGQIDWPWVVGLLNRHGYDGTITLEVFSPDPEYLTISGAKFRRLWGQR